MRKSERMAAKAATIERNTGFEVQAAFKAHYLPIAQDHVRQAYEARQARSDVRNIVATSSQSLSRHFGAVQGLTDVQELLVLARKAIIDAGMPVNDRSWKQAGVPSGERGVTLLIRGANEDRQAFVEKGRAVLDSSPSSRNISSFNAHPGRRTTVDLRQGLALAAFIGSFAPTKGGAADGYQLHTLDVFGPREDDNVDYGPIITFEKK